MNNNSEDDQKSINISELESNQEEEPEFPPVMSVQEATSPYL